MESSVTMQRSQIHSRNGSNAGVRGRSSSKARPWYKRAMGGLLLWKQPAAVEAPAPARARAAHGKMQPPPSWRSSMKAAASAVARAACICEPLCSTDRPHGGVHADAVAPRKRREITRSPIGRSPRATLPAGEWGEAAWSSFRRRTQNEEVLRRRFVLEEEATRWRRGVEVAANWHGRTWLPPPPSRLSVMSLAKEDEDDDVAGDEEGESGSSSFRRSEDQPF